MATQDVSPLTAAARAASDACLAASAALRAARHHREAAGLLTSAARLASAAAGLVRRPSPAACGGCCDSAGQPRRYKCAGRKKESCVRKEKGKEKAEDKVQQKLGDDVGVDRDMSQCPRAGLPPSPGPPSSKPGGEECKGAGSFPTADDATFADPAIDEGKAVSAVVVQVARATALDGKGVRQPTRPQALGLPPKRGASRCSQAGALAIAAATSEVAVLANVAPRGVLDKALQGFAADVESCQEDEANIAKCLRDFRAYLVPYSCMLGAVGNLQSG